AGRASELTVTLAYPVAPPSVAAAVTTFAPNRSATVALNAPAPSAVLLTRTVSPATSTGVAARVTVAPGAVVPLTCTEAAWVTLPSAGAEMTSGSGAGGAGATDPARTMSA